MRIKKTSVFSGILLAFLTGCAAVPKNTVVPEVDLQKTKKETFTVNIKRNMDVFEKELVEVAKKAEYKYNQYIELLKTLKKKHVLASNYIPRNLGKRYTFCFDGYALLLIKKVVTSAGYSFNLGNLLMQDSPIIHRCYKNTMAIDILRDIATGYGYDLIIDEHNMNVTVRYSD